MLNLLPALLVTALTALSHSALAAPCGPPKWIDDKSVQIKSNTVLIATHPSTMWDGRFSSKVGMDAAVKFAKSKNIPVVYLQADVEPETYFFSDCNPDYWVKSSVGKFSFEVPANHVYSVGGHWELCQKDTMRSLIFAWSNKRDVDLTITQVMDGLYNYGYYVNTTDPYSRDFSRFIDIVTYRKPTNHNWPNPKLNLLEMMGIIKDGALEIDYLKRNLPAYRLIHESYEVQLIVNGKLIEVLRKGTGAKPPVLKLEFIDTLSDGDYAPAQTKVP